MNVTILFHASQLFWSRLKIQSPPPLEIVLRHIKLLTERHSQLDRWRYPQTPVKVCATPLRLITYHNTLLVLGRTCPVE